MQPTGGLFDGFIVGDRVVGLCVLVLIFRLPGGAVQLNITEGPFVRGTLGLLVYDGLIPQSPQSLPYIQISEVEFTPPSSHSLSKAKGHKLLQFQIVPFTS